MSDCDREPKILQCAYLCKENKIRCKKIPVDGSTLCKYHSKIPKLIRVRCSHICKKSNQQCKHYISQEGDNLCKMHRYQLKPFNVEYLPTENGMCKVIITHKVSSDSITVTIGI